jgi:hypothetical protein
MHPQYHLQGIRQGRKAKMLLYHGLLDQAQHLTVLLVGNFSSTQSTAAYGVVMVMMGFDGRRSRKKRRSRNRTIIDLSSILICMISGATS